jgi:hypothetical protein
MPISDPGSACAERTAFERLATALAVLESLQTFSAPCDDC